MTLLGPVRPDSSWPAQNEPAYDIRQCPMDWEAQPVPSPRGNTRAAWSPRQARWQPPVISVKFAKKACRNCAGRLQ